MIPIAKPLLGDEELKAIQEVIRSGMIAEGPKVKEFEDKFASYIGTKHGIATSNGTTALHTALLAHGIKKGDEVITSPFTFIATANSILYAGAKPVFADIEEDYFCIDIEKLKEKITSKTKAIIPVHLYGHPAEMKAIMEIAEDKKLIVIEDACQAHGAEENGKKVGSFGTGCFSFYPTKNMTTGEGGMITTDNDKIEKMSKIIRNHGSEKKYYHKLLGFNYRLTDIMAAIGIEQLKKLESFNNKRIQNARMYDDLIKNENIIKPKTRKNCRHVFHQYTVRILRKRERIKKALSEAGIGSSIFYPLPIYKQGLYKNLKIRAKCPISEKISKEVLSLPVHPNISEQDIRKISEVISKC